MRKLWRFSLRKYNLNAAITSALRRTWRNYPPRKEALLSARDPENKKHVICAICQRSVHEKLAHVDHIVPVVPICGVASLDEKVQRMFVPKDGYQILCEFCHDAKTKSEREEKRMFKQAIKPKKEPKRAKKKTL